MYKYFFNYFITLDTYFAGLKILISILGDSTLLRHYIRLVSTYNINNITKISKYKNSAKHIFTVELDSYIYTHVNKIEHAH